jgi:formate dehydrogenase iron-sulfur subunit
MKFYVSNDSTARAAGADRVATALAKVKDAQVVRTSSRGAFFLEPLVEIDTPAGRAGYANVKPEAVAGLVANAPTTPPVPISEMHFLSRQTRVTFATAGLNEPLAIENYDFKALDKARGLDPQKVLDEVKTANLRGRGGAAFPAGTKWQTTKDAPGDIKYVVANADEGDPGTYSDRMIMEGDPFRLIEGMAICARAVGATQGYIYIRSEYPAAIKTMRAAIAKALQNGVLGPQTFLLDIFVGAGAYICGEETALLESLEGKRGMVRPKPPFPAVQGLWQKPTVINNVITFASVPDIIRRGGAWHASIGTEKSKGTMPLQLSGRIKNAGLVEVPFGVTLEEVLYNFGGGMPAGSKFKAVQVGGPLGSIFPESLLQTRICFDDFIKNGGILGHGGIVVYDQDMSMVELARHFMEFTADESCGKCTPCRVGSTRAKEILEGVSHGDATDEDLALLQELGETMKLTSLCALGGLAPEPVRTAMQYFGSEFKKR